jgi:hypothetical protein
VIVYLRLFLDISSFLLVFLYGDLEIDASDIVFIGDLGVIF